MKKIFVVLLVLASPWFSFSAQKNLKADVFKKSYIKKAMKKAVDWQLKNPKYQPYEWTNGAFYAGVYSAYETTGSKKMYDAMVKMGRSVNWRPGPRLFHADEYAICQTYVDIYRKEKERSIINPTLAKVDSFMTLPYVPTLSQEKISEDRTVWWWCDALFMAPPLFVKLGVTFKDKKYLDWNDRLFRNTYDLLYDKEEHLFARDLRFKWNVKGIEPLKEANGKKIFWSRGNGWVMAGIARILQELPGDYPKRDFYAGLLKEMAERIVTLQQEDGFWRASLLDPGSYPGGETSGTGFYCYALAWGINNGLLDKEFYLPVVEKAWITLASVQKENGMIGWVQPVGADPRSNFSSESWETYGTGAFLLAASQIIKLK